tara:strand:+ start:33807 stop:35045 length:1239 start_codon:yes stop_codon:yes gene_type:complete
MNKYRIWHDNESFANFIINHTNLKKENYILSYLYKSDASDSKNFHSVPDHIKQILYLDAPDVIVEKNNEPLFSIEISTEAGTGHNVFQRFARLAASVENDVPTFYIYPEAKLIKRKGNKLGWDKLNPLIFFALERIMQIYEIPALFYYYPSTFQKFKTKPDKAPFLPYKGLLNDSNPKFMSCPDSTDSEMIGLFSVIDDFLKCYDKNGIIDGRKKLKNILSVSKRRMFMSSEYHRKNGSINSSPNTSTITIPTEYLLNYLKKYNTKNYQIGGLLRSRKETVIYFTDSKFRGDPYPGAFSAIDFMQCRVDKTFEDREKNLVLLVGKLKLDPKKKTIEIDSKKSSIDLFINDVKTCTKKDILGKDYNELKNAEIPRYYMQVRYGTTFSKSKHIRVYSYFADCILFKDGALWRDG